MFEPTRLTLARKKRGLSKKNLAALVGLQPQSIINFESEIINEIPSEKTLDLIADVLKFPVEFFDKCKVDFPSLESASFRALSKMTASQRDEALSCGQLAFEINDWIENKFILPKHELPDLRDYKPEEAALMIRQMWGLGNKPISNMLNLLESKGIRVFFIALDEKNVDAFSIWNNGTPFVLLNNFKSSERSRFDAAHELGHLVLHKHGYLSRDKIIEQEANNFASCFLMPSESIKAEAPKVPTFDNLVKMKLRWKVSLASLLYRLSKLELLSEWQYRTWVIKLNKEGYNQKEPFSIPREYSLILKKVFELLKQNNKAKSEIARDISWSFADVQKAISGLVEINGGNLGNAKQSEANLHIVD